jgi:hypothetical protein
MIYPFVSISSPYPFPFISEGEGDSSSEGDVDSDSFGSYQIPSPVDRKRPCMEQPNPHYIPEDENFPRQSNQWLIFDSKEQPEAESLNTVTSWKSRKVRKSGQRKKNKLHAAPFAITKVD